jgi:hypothetical protein
MQSRSVTGHTNEFIVFSFNSIVRHATIEEVLRAAFSVGPLRVSCYVTVWQTHLCSRESTPNNKGSGVFCGSALRPYHAARKSNESSSRDGRCSIELGESAVEGD